MVQQALAKSCPCSESTICVNLILPLSVVSDAAFEVFAALNLPQCQSPHSCRYCTVSRSVVAHCNSSRRGKVRPCVCILTDVGILETSGQTATLSLLLLSIYNM